VRDALVFTLQPLPCPALRLSLAQTFSHLLLFSSVRHLAAILTLLTAQHLEPPKLTGKFDRPRQDRGQTEHNRESRVSSAPGERSTQNRFATNAHQEDSLTFQRMIRLEALPS
jgi:hypothetical protein